MTAYAIFGTGGVGRQIPHFLAPASDLVFVLDEPTDRTCNGLPVISYAELAQPRHRSRRVIVAVADPTARREITSRCIADGFVLGDAVASGALIYNSAAVGAGLVMHHYALISVDVQIGRGFHINHYSHVSHDCRIGDFVTFATHVCCNGNVYIDDLAYIGAGAVLRQGSPATPLRIGRGAIVGMGSVVTKNVAPYSVVVGNPAREIRKIND